LPGGLRTVIQEPGWAKDAGRQSFRSDVEELIAGKLNDKKQ
jgi:hypothetical protein